MTTCPRTGARIDECYHCTSLATPIPVSYHVTHRFASRYSGGRCQLNPEHRSAEGEMIGHVERRGGDRTRVKVGWVCAACADRIEADEKREALPAPESPWPASRVASSAAESLWPDTPASRLVSAARNPYG